MSIGQAKQLKINKKNEEKSRKEGQSLNSELLLIP